MVRVICSFLRSRSEETHRRVLISRPQIRPEVVRVHGTDDAVGDANELLSEVVDIVGDEEVIAISCSEVTIWPYAGCSRGCRTRYLHIDA